MGKNSNRIPQNVQEPIRDFIKVILLGNSSVGKTSVINRFICREFTDQFRATIGAEFYTKQFSVDNKICTLQIWDTAGLERFRTLGTAFYRGCDCCILCYDVTDPKSFEGLLSWRDEFLERGDPHNPESFPFAVIGNKIDLEGRRVSKREAEQWCSLYPSTKYFETSAKASTGVDEMFQEIVREALKREKRNSLMEGIFDRKVQLTDSRRNRSLMSCNC